ncbi:uncharacterized protein [Heterodontus francisci]|uniref:uncharacterized protein n=1 Tax=Heterodontus francisci TaxID=7792 RepID=UPI00355C1244
MMNGIAVFHFVGASFSIILVQCIFVSISSEVFSLSPVPVNFDVSSSYTEADESLKTASQRQDGNDVSTQTNSPLGNANVFATDSSSNQTVFSTIATSENLQDNAMDNFTLTGISERSSTPITSPLTPNISAVTQNLTTITQRKEHKREPTKETRQHKGQGIMSGVLVAIIIVIVLTIIIVIAVIFCFTRKGKHASYSTSNYELAVPMNEVCTETPNE